MRALDAIAASGAVFDDASATSPWTKPSHASLLTGLYPSRNGAVTTHSEMAKDAVHLASLLARSVTSEASSVRLQPRSVARGALAAVAIAGLTAASTAPGSQPASPVTFNRHIAPLLFEHCAPCHRPGESAPFNLLTYRDARRRGEQIVHVTQSRFMPPWLPEPGHGSFVGERRLADDEIALLRNWVNQGMVEGDAADLPPAPQWTPGWQLGPPDLVLQMGEPYTLPADGVDVYRNFILPVPIEGHRWVRAVEFRPGNPRVVHHARMYIDRRADSRRRDETNPKPGFEGMSIDSAESPDGVLLGWTPGKLPLQAPEGVAWRLEAGSDLVLQLHMLPTGKPETLRSLVGLYFSDRPPTRPSFAFVLGSREIDIPAGATSHVIEDDYVLPVDVELTGIYPHAHYLGKRMRVEAQRPDGEVVPLLLIRDWDFNWQDEYQYVRPPALPRGTRISMRYTFDNSTANVRNPSNPARRVRYGARTSDEMAELLLQVLPRDRDALQRLAVDFERKKIADAIAFRRKRIAADPEEPSNHAALGSTYLEAGSIDEAIRHLDRAARLDPTDTNVRNNIGYALRMADRPAEALSHYLEAVRLDPNFVAARVGLAITLDFLDRPADSIPHYRAAIAVRPDSAALHHGLAVALQRSGETDDALAGFEEAARLAPDSVSYLNDLAWRLATRHDRGPGDAARARAIALRAAALTGQTNPIVMATLAAAHAAAGELDEAVAAAERAVSLSSERDIAAIQAQLADYRARLAASRGRRTPHD